MVGYGSFQFPHALACGLLVTHLAFQCIPRSPEIRRHVYVVERLRNGLVNARKLGL